MASRDLISQFRGLTLDNVGTWPAAPRIVLWLVVIAAFGVGGWFGLWSGQEEQLTQLQAEEEKLKRRLQDRSCSRRSISTSCASSASRSASMC